MYIISDMLERKHGDMMFKKEEAKKGRFLGFIVYFIVKYMRSDKYKLKKEKKEVKNVNLEPPKDRAIKKNSKVKKTKKQKQEKIEKL